MDQLLKEIAENQYKNTPRMKKKWYKVGKALLQGEKLKLHTESKTTARRTYRYYTLGKGDWVGPSPRQLGKMKRNKFNEQLEDRRQQKEAELLLEISELISNSRGEDLLGVESLSTGHVTESCEGQVSCDASCGQVHDESTVAIYSDMEDHWLISTIDNLE